MPKNTSVVLGKEHDKFIKTQIKKGRFASASEVMRAGLRLLEEQELKIDSLRSAIVAGEHSGSPQNFEMNAYIAEKRKQSDAADSTVPTGSCRSGWNLELHGIILGRGAKCSYLSALDATMKVLASNPRMGRSIDEIREGYFKFPAAAHLLIYRLKPGAIEFMRILTKAVMSIAICDASHCSRMLRDFVAQHPRLRGGRLSA